MIEFIQADITCIPVDGIVNAANDMLRIGGGVDGAIHRAGGPGLREDFLRVRAEKGSCLVGHAVVTVAGALPAKFVIHAVGPVWEGGHKQERLLLYQTYYHSLQLAGELGLKSVSFPNISTGVFRFPKADAAVIAYQAVLDYLSAPESGIERVVFVCFDSENLQLYKALKEKEEYMSNLRRFLDAQESYYDTALDEIRRGRKTSHWIWYVFPQLRGLGSSRNAEYYGIKDIQEAVAYLSHPILGTRLVLICEALMGVSGKTAFEILGSPDDFKLRSSMTLFSGIPGCSPVFNRVLDQYFGGVRCAYTESNMARNH